MVLWMDGKFSRSFGVDCQTIINISANQIIIFQFPEMKILYPVRHMHRITTFTAPKVQIAPKTVFDGSADAHRIFNILRLEREMIQFSMPKLENVWSYGRSNYRIPVVHVCVRCTIPWVRPKQLIPLN